MLFGIEFRTKKVHKHICLSPSRLEHEAPKLVMFKYIHFMAQLLLNAAKTKDYIYLNHIKLR